MDENKNPEANWKRVFKTIAGPTAMKVILIAAALFWLMIVAASWAESAQAADPEPDSPAGASAPTAATTDRAPASFGNDSSEYNFNWLDKDKKIYVLQNRRYTKTGHVFLSLMGGPGLSNPYRDAWSLDPRISYYFSEAFGIEAFYTKTFNSPNSTYKALQAINPTTVPIVREINSEAGIMAQWVPWYAKINMFNQILYFDWYVQAGLGQLGTDLETQQSVQSAPSYANQNLFALYLGTGHIYHIDDDWIFRIDFTGSYYHAPLQGNAGSNTWFSNYNFELGFGYRL